MILQVLSDTRQLMQAGDAVLAEGRRVADARQHHQLRRLERAGREDDLAPARSTFFSLPCMYSTATARLPSKMMRGGVCLRLDAQVGPAAHVRMDVAARRAPAFAIPLGHLVDAEAFLLGAVEIVADPELGLARALAGTSP